MPPWRNRLWKARHEACFVGLQLRPGSRPSTAHVCVPIRRFAQCVTRAAAELDHAAFRYMLGEHAGVGRPFSCSMLLDPDDAGQWAVTERINASLLHRAIAMDGTGTGDHGVGPHKMKLMGQNTARMCWMDLMRCVKRAFDPNDILNPGKMLPVRA
ncbi:MAG TPA: FAD-linked oxidase C-terminal domain-containing protein [Rhodanobacteraceae bacterium]|nr:FAD-linked oxidase C-terminal domain-containing protein [Rhodanobacteraceae bacterium]